MRGIGPRAFISYSFQDREIATRLRDFLTASGFQVRMENETSLLNQRLPDVLPQRVNDAECFIQLRTTASNKSHWVAKEFEYAEQRRARDEAFALVPIVLDAATLDGRTREWVYVDASEGLTDSVLALVRDTGLRCVRRLRVDPSVPTSPYDADVQSLLADSEAKRVIVDADGFWLDRLDDLLHWAEASQKTNERAGFLAQERSRRERLMWLLERADVAARVLTRELRSRVQQSIVATTTAKAALVSFYRLLFEDAFWPIVQNALLAKTMTLADDVAGLPRFGDMTGLEGEGEGIRWTLKPILQERARIVTPPKGDRMVRTGMAPARAVHSAYVYFPATVLGSDWKLVREPQAIVMEQDWARFGLPQIAARAVRLTGRHNPETRESTFEEIDKGMGWALSDYRHMGPP